MLKTSALLSLMKVFGSKFRSYQIHGETMLYPSLNKHFERKKGVIFISTPFSFSGIYWSSSPRCSRLWSHQSTDWEVQTFSVRVRQPLYRYVTQCCYQFYSILAKWMILVTWRRSLPYLSINFPWNVHNALKQHHSIVEGNMFPSFVYFAGCVHEVRVWCIFIQHRTKLHLLP